MSEELWPWDFVVLQLLRDGEPKHLKVIYAAVKEREGAGGIKERLFKVNGKYGCRPDYTHVIRGIMGSLKKRGMVKHLRTGKNRTGMYQITDDGRKRLEEVEL